MIFFIVLIYKNMTTCSVCIEDINSNNTITCKLL